MDRGESMSVWFYVVHCFESMDDNLTNFKVLNNEERIILRKRRENVITLYHIFPFRQVLEEI